MPYMNKHSSDDFIKLELERISFDEWVEQCKLSADLGQEWIINWVSQNAATYRKEWNQSICQFCKYCFDKNILHHYKKDKNTQHFCGLNMSYKCNQFKEMEEPK